MSVTTFISIHISLSVILHVFLIAAFEPMNVKNLIKEKKKKYIIIIIIIFIFYFFIRRGVFYFYFYQERCIEDFIGRGISRMAENNSTKKGTPCFYIVFNLS